MLVGGAVRRCRDRARAPRASVSCPAAPPGAEASASRSMSKPVRRPVSVSSSVRPAGTCTGRSQATDVEQVTVEGLAHRADRVQAAGAPCPSIVTRSSRQVLGQRRVVCVAPVPERAVRAPRCPPGATVRDPPNQSERRRLVDSRRSRPARVLAVTCGHGTLHGRGGTVGPRVRRSRWRGRSTSIGAPPSMLSDSCVGTECRPSRRTVRSSPSKVNGSPMVHLDPSDPPSR